MTAAISSSTAAAWSNALFDKIDTKKQGYIDQAQLEAAFGTEDTEAAGQLMSQLDTDSDGKVTKSELSSAVDKLVDALNAQQDGRRMRPEGAPPGGPRAAGAEGASGETYDPADANQDGTVSDTEQAAFDARAAEKRRETDPQRELARALHMLKAYTEQQAATDEGSAVSTAA